MYETHRDKSQCVRLSKLLVNKSRTVCTVNMMCHRERPPFLPYSLFHLELANNRQRSGPSSGMENSQLRRVRFPDATHEEARQYIKSSALIVLKLPAINSLCSGNGVIVFSSRSFANTDSFDRFSPSLVE